MSRWKIQSRQKGIVKREVVRIVTPGTNLDTQALDETKNNYIMCIVYIADRYGVSIADISTGDYFVTELPDGSRLMDEIYKFSPSEIICNEAFYMSGMDPDTMKEKLGITIYFSDSWYFDDAMCREKLLEHFKVSSFAGLGLEDYDCGVISAGALLTYLLETQEKFPFQPDASDSIRNGKIYDAGQLDKKKCRSCARHSGKSRKEVPFCGCWIRREPPWEHVPCESSWSSL